MIKIFFTTMSLCLAGIMIFAQNIGIGTTSPNTSAALDISNTAKGLLIPRMTSASVTAIPNPAKGLMVYDSLSNQLMVNMGTPITPNWKTIVANSGWSLTGNNGINPSTQFIGNTDNQPLKFRINNTVAGELNPSGNIFWGLRAGQASTSAYSNIAIGTDALKLNTFRGNLIAIGDSALFNNATVTTGYDYGGENTAIGSKSLFSNTNGYENTAIGFQSLYYNAGGSTNTAIGVHALYQNTSGYNNTANGAYALPYNSTATNNTANGAFALYANSSGSYNTAEGSQALYYNSTGNENTAAGYKAMEFSTTGNNNTATGVGTLATNSAGSDNTAVGHSALYKNSGSLGSYNTAVGSYALVGTTNSQYNTVIGYNAGSNYDLGYNNTILGANCDAAFTGAYNDIAIGQGVTCTDNSQARIGNSATSSIGGYAAWTKFSDGRYKKNVKENVKGIEFIMKLRPVTYNLDVTALSQRLNESRGKEVNPAMKTAMADKEKVAETGFVAQEVEQAAKETGYEFSGVDKPKTDTGLYGLRYAEFVVPLVKAVQEQQQQIEQLKKENTDSKQTIIALQNRLAAIEKKLNP